MLAFGIGMRQFVRHFAILSGFLCYILAFPSVGLAQYIVAVDESRLIDDQGLDIFANGLSELDTGIKCLVEDSVPGEEMSPAMLSTLRQGQGPLKLDDAESNLNIWRQIDVIAISPGEFTGLRGDDEVVSEIVQAVIGANKYLKTLKLQIYLAGVQIFRDDYFDPFADVSYRGDAFGMLNVLHNEWQNRAHPEHDLRVVLGRGNFHSTFGLAYAASSCVAKDYAVLFVSQGGDFSGAKLSIASTLAHEVGHFLGMGHDNTSPASLMWPFFRNNADGFSGYSIAQYERHAGVGAPGGECFTGIYPPNFSTSDSASEGNSALAFSSGSEQRVQVYEGGVLKSSFRVDAHDELPGLTYEAYGLPPGAMFDPRTAELFYAPDFSVANRKQPIVSFPVSIIARTSLAVSELTLLIDIYDTNRKPRILTTAAVADERNEIIVEQGQDFYVEFWVEDDDALDQVKSFQLINRFVLNEMPGARFKKNGNRGSFKWSVPNDYLKRQPLSFRAVDSSRLSSEKTFWLAVAPKNAAPAIEISSAISANASADVLYFAVKVHDPEGAPVVIDISNLPKGSIVTYNPQGATVQYAVSEDNTTSLSQELVISASDGMRTSSQSLSVSSLLASIVSSSDDLRWPGVEVARQEGGGGMANVGGGGFVDNRIALYNSHSGRWQDVDCMGNVVEGPQFGGFFGDIPLLYKDGLGLNRAVYRNAGEWFISGTGSEGVSTTQWGLADDVPLVADFDSDGKGDLAVFRPGDGWYIKFSAMPEQHLQDTFQLIGDRKALLLPLVGDIDGDTYSDRIIFKRSANGETFFYSWLANGNRHAFTLGQVPFVDMVEPLVGDFDGDGRSDLGIKTTSGLLRIFFSKAREIKDFVRSPRSGEKIAIGDCDANGTEELVLLNKTRGEVEVRNFVDGRTTSFAHEVLAGDTTVYSARLLGSYAKQIMVYGDSDGDGQTNLAVWRPEFNFSAGKWFEKRRSSGLLAREIGDSGDFEALLPRDGGAHGVFESMALKLSFGFPVAGDFYGDGNNSPTIFSNGRWISRLANGQDWLEERWGLNGDVPVACDYNGDGITDYAIFRPGDASWYLLIQNKLKQQVRALYWGEQEDIPVPADYDGDAVCDIAVWRPSSGEWYILFADGSVKITSWGQEGDVPVQADFDGDAVADIAVWRPGTGQWNILTDEDALVINWGLSTDQPVQGDFNGDGRHDLAVWRPESGLWAALPISNFGERPFIEQFGLNGDLPLGSWKGLRVY